MEKIVPDLVSSTPWWSLRQEVVRLLYCGWCFRKLTQDWGRLNLTRWTRVEFLAKVCYCP